MKAKNWDRLISAFNYTVRRSPVGRIESFLWNRLDAAVEREHKPTAHPDFMLGQIAGVYSTRDEDELDVYVSSGPEERDYRVIRVLKGFGLDKSFQQYGLFKLHSPRMEEVPVYKLLFTESTPKKTLDSFIDFYDDYVSTLENLCEE